MAAALAGCGGASTHAAATAGSTAAVPARVQAQLDAAHRQVTASLHHLAKQDTAYGGVPAYLPKPELPVDRVLSASASHHVLAAQGTTVALKLVGGGAHITAVGPHVPSSVVGTKATKTTARFDVSLSSVHGEFRIAPSWFTITDQLGHVHRPSVRLAHGGPAPATATEGHSVRLSVRSVLPEGTGLLRYGPAPTRSLIGWDFTVETD